jgi:hypothetical protein
MADLPDLPPALERLLQGGEHDAIGAYALDALPRDERDDFERHLAGCEQCQAELVVLRESASVLRQAIMPSNGAAPPDPPVVAAPLPEAPRREDAAYTQAPIPPDDGVEEQGRLDAGTQADGAPDSRPAPDATERIPEVGMAEEVARVEVETTASETGVEQDRDAGEVGAAPVASAESTVVEEPVDAPPPPAKPKRKLRPRGRVAPGITPPPGAMVPAEPSRPRLPWIIAGLGVVFGIVAIVAALALAESKDNLEDEIAFQNAYIEDLNQQREAYLEQTTAITWTLEPTTLGSPDSTAVVYADPAGTQALLSVTGMTSLGSDQTYQVWYLPPGGEPEPGPVFGVDGQGDAAIHLEPNLDQYEALAMTIEPSEGSEIPSTDPVIQGFVSVQ